MNQEETSFLLQKQVRDNSEDLQKELLDLKNWEKEMKRKEEELLNSSSEKIRDLPPIRNSKKKKIIETSPPIPSTSKASVPERIKSFDYDSWNQFDADAACRKMDEESDSDEEAENVIESAGKKHSEAVKFKDQGNNFFQKKQYDLAINSYNEAIKIFPWDEIFYANRALCYLKQSNFYSAEADCTAALQINNNYVKAYHRRALARIELEDYDAAKRDIERVLNLEPSNKEAMTMLKNVNKKLEKYQPLKISEVIDDTPIEKKIGEKLCKSSSKLKEESKVNKQSTQKSTKLKITEISDVTNNERHEGEKLKNTKSDKLSIEILEQQPIGKNLPDWLPKLDENYSIVQPIELPPHQRSKEPMKKLVIKKVHFGDNILPKHDVETKCDDIKNVASKEKKNAKIDEINVVTNLKKSPKKTKKEEGKIEEINIVTNLEKSPKKTIKEESKIEEINVVTNSENSSKKTKKEKSKIEIEQINDLTKTNNVEKATKEKENDVINKPKTLLIENVRNKNFPPPPKTAVQFFTEWKRNKSPEFRAFYLKQIRPNTIPTLFKDSMESSVLEEIITIIRDKFTSTELNIFIIFEYLDELSNIKRFRSLIMFIESRTKEVLRELLEHCKNFEDKSEQEIDRLVEKYEL